MPSEHLIAAQGAKSETPEPSRTKTLFSPKKKKTSIAGQAAAPEFFEKEKNGKETPWHQDGEYWPIKPLESVTVWLSIDEVTEENGPLQYIPGSHLDKKLAEHNTVESTNVTLNQTLKNIDEIKDQAKSVHLKPGMFSMHDVYLFHGSRANNSGKRRAGLTYRYMPATSFFDHVGAKTIEDKVGYSLQRELHLLSGENKGGSKIFKNHKI